MKMSMQYHRLLLYAGFSRCQTKCEVGGGGVGGVGGGVDNVVVAVVVVVADVVVLGVVLALFAFLCCFFAADASGIFDAAVILAVNPD